VLIGHSASIHDLEITDDGKYAISLDNDKTILVWNLKKGILIQKLGNSRDFFTEFSLIPAGNNIITQSGDAFVSIWNFIKGKRLRDLSGHTDIVLCESLTEDNKFIITSGRDKTIRVWEKQTGKCLRVLTGHNDWIQFVQALPESDLAISVSYDKTVRIWDLNKSTCFALLYLTAMNPVVAFSVSGKLLIGTGTGEVLFFKVSNDCKNHKQIETEDFHDNRFKHIIRKFADPIKRSLLSLLEIVSKK
jgi:WD40 repeat protein